MNSVLEIDDDGNNRLRHVRPERALKIGTTTLDLEPVESGAEQIDLLKVDTQGFDLSVLEGGRRTFSEGRIHNVLVELSFLPMYKGHASSLDVLAFLEEQDFCLVDLYEKVRQESYLAWCTAFCTRLC